MQKQNNVPVRKYLTGSKHLDNAVAMAYAAYKHYKSLDVPTAIKMAVTDTNYHWKFRALPRMQIEKHLRNCIEYNNKKQALLV